MMYMLVIKILRKFNLIYYTDKERCRNVKNPFYSNPYIYNPPTRNAYQPRNTGASAFRTQSQINDLMRDIVKPKDQMMTTYQIDTTRALTANYMNVFEESKPAVTCPGNNVKTNYHYSNYPTNKQIIFKNTISKIKSTGNLNPDNVRSTFTTLGFKNKQTKALGLKESMNRIFRRKNNVPVFDFTTKYHVNPVISPSTQRDYFKEARPMAINRPRVYSPMTRYRICDLLTS